MKYNEHKQCDATIEVLKYQEIRKDIWNWEREIYVIIVMHVKRKAHNIYSIKEPVHYNNVTVWNIRCSFASIFYLRYSGTHNLFIAVQEAPYAFIKECRTTCRSPANLTGQRKINFPVVSKMLSWKDLFGILREYFYITAGLLNILDHVLFTLWSFIKYYVTKAFKRTHMKVFTTIIKCNYWVNICMHCHYKFIVLLLDKYYIYHCHCNGSFKQN